MKRLKLVLVLVLLAALGLLLDLRPGPATELPEELKEYLALPDVDLRAQAEELWRQGEREAALSLLEYILDNELPDAPAAAQLHTRYLDEMKADRSLLGRAGAFGRGALTGKVDSLEGLAGSSVADFFVVGDIRDLVVQSFAKDPDEFILALSAIGLATTAWPPADPAASALKTAKKAGALTEPLQKQIVTVARLARAQKSLPVLRGALEPVWNLAGRCRTWSQFKTFLRHSDDLSHVKLFNRILGSPRTVRRTEQILTPLRKSPDVARSALHAVDRHGQAALDSLYVAVRKGPAGLARVARHPTFYARLGKNLVKAGGLAERTVRRRWQEWSRLHSSAAQLAWWSLFGLTTLSLAWILVGWLGPWLRWDAPAGAAASVAPSLSASASATPASAAPASPAAASATPASPASSSSAPASAAAAAPVRRPVRLLASLAATALLAAAAWQFVPPRSPLDRLGPALPVLAERPSGSPFPPPAESPTSAPEDPMSILTLLLTVLLPFAIQVVIGIVLYRMARTIEKKDLGAELRLQDLEAMDILFDLPLFVGLLFSVLSFMFLSMSFPGSRLLAYSATAGGIVVAGALRVFVHYPTRRRLTDELRKRGPGA